MIASLMALAATTAHIPSQLPGSWEGTIGNLPVRACFVEREWGAFGAYYYLSRLRLIPLETEEGSTAAFREGDRSDASLPRWLIQSADAANVTGQWTGGRRSLPIRLHRLTRASGEDSACASLAFHQPRLAGVHTVSVRASKDGVAYTRLTLDHGGHFGITAQTFAIDGESEAVRRLNATLGEPLAGNPPHWFECISDSLGAGPNEGEYDETIEPAMISRRWLSATDRYDGFCGGAHPDAGSTYRTFDLTTGREVDPHDWFTAAAVKREHFEGSDEDSKTLEPAFRTFLLSGRHADDADCEQAVRDEEFWNIGLTRAGFVFTPLLPHVAGACVEEIAVPFARMAPYLTPEGAEIVRAFQSER